MTKPQLVEPLDASRRAIDAAATHHGLLVRDAHALQRDVKGEVVAESSQHVLVKMSGMIGVRYKKADLDRPVRIGEKVSIAYTADKSRGHEQGKEAKVHPGRQGPVLGI